MEAFITNPTVTCNKNCSATVENRNSRTEILDRVVWQKHKQQRCTLQSITSYTNKQKVRFHQATHMRQNATNVIWPLKQHER